MESPSTGENLILLRATFVSDLVGLSYDYFDSSVADALLGRYGAFLKNYQYLAELHAKYPLLPLLATEATLEAPGKQHLGTSPWKQGQMYSVDIMGDLNAFATGWIEWNVLLDTKGIVFA